LTWADRSDNESAFEIQRAADANFTKDLMLFTPGPNTTSALQTVASGKTYYYRIRSVNPITGQSAWVNATPFPITTR
jgi:predicted phage tail protein